MQWFDKQFTELTVNELFAILKLRAQVFNGEQQSSYPDPDDSDPLAHHVFATTNGEVVAYARYFIQNDVVTFWSRSCGSTSTRDWFRWKDY